MIKGTFACIDAHTCGNPVRVVTSGHPDLCGTTMSEKRQHFIEHYDWIRRALMFEPRGHDLMSGAFIYPACRDNADASILFLETTGCLPMCGHGTIGTVTVGLERGLIQPKRPGELCIDVPAGQIHLSYTQVGDKVTSVTLYNVASFLCHRDIVLTIEGLGPLVCDIAYGGNFYVIIEPQTHFPGMQQWNAEQLAMYSRKVLACVNQSVHCVHPLDATVAGCKHVLWTGSPSRASSDGANAVFYGGRAIDRSPCGTGTSARLAQRYARGYLSVGETYVHESYIGSQFTGRVEALTQVGEYSAIKPSIQSWAKVYGDNTIIVDDDDPYAEGFQIR